MAIAVLVGILFLVISSMGNKQFHVLQTATDQYITCEHAANNLQDGSDYLTEQVRLFVTTGDRQFMDNYFEEAEVTCRRENALEELRANFEGTSTFSALQSALACSEKLMNTEYYAMRLVLEANAVDESTWPEAVQTVSLSSIDSALSAEDKLSRAQQEVTDGAYEAARTEIISQVNQCMNSLIEETRNQQGRAVSVFSDMYLKMEIGIGILVLLMLLMVIVVRRLVVKPLVKCNESIVKGEMFPVIGAEEVQVLAETYNKVYQDNEEAQRLLRHKAEHDPLTDLLNRGAFEKLLKLHQDDADEAPFALVIVDVDCFKQINDGFGHAVGDETLKRISSMLCTTFRSIDFVCRIGGDEFAVIMVEMTSDLGYTIQDKINAMNEMLSRQAVGMMPKVSLSVGVAFSDRKHPTGTIFQDADQALYERKEHGKCGCTFYGADSESKPE